MLIKKPHGFTHLERPPHKLLTACLSSPVFHPLFMYMILLRVRGNFVLHNFSGWDLRVFIIFLNFQMVHCASCCEPYHEFCVGEAAFKGEKGTWRWDWICPRCTMCAACGRASGHQLTCERCQNSYHTECVGGRLLHSPDRPWVGINSNT